MYKSRVVDLLRIATQGSGVLPDGELNADLVNRLADEAAKTSRHVLQMCIRALDYCPPVDVTFGDYLRAIITADRDLFPEDEHNYRTAVMQSFSLYGIRPKSVRNISLEGLMLQGGDPKLGRAVPRNIELDLDNEDRELSYERMIRNARRVHRWLAREASAPLLEAAGIVTGKAPPTVSQRDGRPKFEVHSVRTALRRGSKTNLVPDLVVEITQRRTGYFDEQDQTTADKGAAGTEQQDEHERGDFTFRRGCTLVVSATTGEVRWIARTQDNVGSDVTLGKLRGFLMNGALPDAFHSPVAPGFSKAPFAALHRD
jgi:hypothetical protein